MKLYWCPKTRAQRALWMAEEVGEPYELVTVDIRSEEPRPPEFLAASPMGKVPALEDGEVRVADSAAVCLYLADRYAGGRLAPPVDHPDRGRFLYWMFYTPSVIEPAMYEKVESLEPNRFRNGWGDFDTMVSTLEAGLGDGPWILGADFSAADVMVGSSTIFLRAFGLMPPSPALEAYADRCQARPGYRTAAAADAD